MRENVRTDRAEDSPRQPRRDGRADVASKPRVPHHHGEDEHPHDRHRTDQTWAARAAASGKAVLADVTRALSSLPATTAVMTAGHEHARAGMLVHRVMACADEPAMLCVAVRKGHHLASIIRDARCFGVCMIEPTQRLIMRKFAAAPVTDINGNIVPDKDDNERPDSVDPFDSMQVMRLVSTAPILARAWAAMDCEVVRHLDLDADCELYVGQVLAVQFNGDSHVMPGRDAGEGGRGARLPFDPERLGA